MAAKENETHGRRTINVKVGDYTVAMEIAVETFQKITSKDPKISKPAREQLINDAKAAVSVASIESRIPTDTSPTVPLGESSSDPNISKPAREQLINDAKAAVSVASIESQTPTDTSPTVPTGESSSDVFLWTEKQTKLLFTTRSEMEAEFHKAKCHKTLWIRIADVLNQKGTNVTPEQCSNKWKNLKKDFKRAVDNNAKTGTPPQKCRFYEDFNVLYGCKSGVRPKCTMSSAAADSGEKDDTEKDDDDDDDYVHVTHCKVAKRERKKNISPTLEFLQEYSQRQELKNEQREEMATKRHDDKMHLMTRFLNVFESAVKSSD